MFQGILQGIHSACQSKKIGARQKTLQGKKNQIK